MAETEAARYLASIRSRNFAFDLKTITLQAFQQIHSFEEF